MFNNIREVLSLMEERYGVEVTGICRICGVEGLTEMHHIISQAKAKKLGRDDLLTNPGNIVELCIECHDMTDSSVFFRLHHAHRKKLKALDDSNDDVRARNRRIRSRNIADNRQEFGRCHAMLRNGKRRCLQSCEPNEVTCRNHWRQREEIQERLESESNGQS
jgi:hypothetical protein